jgi:predicted transcriptional regulator
MESEKPRVVAEASELLSDLRDALVETMGDPFQARVYTTVTERPGATIAQIAARIGESPRRVRHQIEHLLKVGLVHLDSKTQKRNAREHHYRAVALAKFQHELDSSWDDDQRRKLALSVTRMITGDIGQALRAGILGTSDGHAEVRVSAEVDAPGWQELADIMEKVMGEIEGTVIRSAARLEASGLGGTEVVAALLLFETPAWERSVDDLPGPRPSQWRSGELSADDPPVPLTRRPPTVEDPGPPG